MNFWRILLPVGLLLAPFIARGGGDEVVVIYNSQLPESKAVAEHYAAARAVPEDHVFGFGLTTNEIITRADFTDFLQKPLADRLEATGLWKFAEADMPALNGQAQAPASRVVQSKIRYAVLCYGVPLKIASAVLPATFEDKAMIPEFRRNDASVDSELAWLPLLRAKVPLTGPLQNSFYLCTNRARLDCTNGILLVSRLDGPTADIATHLVDKAMAAEATGLWGRAYVDARGIARQSPYYIGDEWMLASADLCRQLGFETEVDTNEATLPASFPMSHIAIYAGWYAFDPCGPFLAPKMEFMPGAIAYHLNSFSAATLRSANNCWCGPLLARGATCTMGCVNEPYLIYTPNIAFCLQALASGDTFGEAAWAAQPVLSWQTAVIGDPLYRPFHKTSAELHALLARTHSPLLEWSFDRLICLDLAHGLRAPPLATFLANLPLTAQSAVLNELLANLYEASGKPSSAIAAWQTALQLNPSPQQRLRLRLTLGQKLVAQGRVAEAMANYRALIAEAPDYPGRNEIDEKLKALEPKPAAKP
jgi:uncharacterized protein (TIGR03790 family)